MALDKFSALCSLFEELRDFDFEIHEKHVNILQYGNAMHFPLPLPRIKLEHIACGYANWLFNKYHLQGFVEVEDGDIIIDCGAFVGGFSVACANIAKLIIAIEPSSLNYFCLDNNLKPYENALALRFALGNECGVVQLNCSTSAVEHSLLEPDDGDILYTETVAISRVDALIKSIGIDRVDFLKLEAEGFEPEIITGLGELRPKKLAIDVSPERNNESPANEIIKVLVNHGYECKQRGHVLFARRTS
ncbi:FkbM family methyltransferase [Lacimicrobium sp. SS2-24]|uniref:FkbM family methyltransferase n=1 Tax=Lacimicrobium sp. SS2-24 TaxID=2005569 RepID=UPI00143965D9|nr:FkbM family methyltransferase [Lacimicrobium sp. SS2-24]